MQGDGCGRDISFRYKGGADLEGEIWRDCREMLHRCADINVVSLFTQLGHFCTFYSQRAHTLWRTSGNSSKENVRRKACCRGIDKSDWRTNHSFTLSTVRHHGGSFGIRTAWGFPHTPALTPCISQKLLLLSIVRLQRGSPRKSPPILRIKLQLASETTLSGSPPREGHSCCPRGLNFLSLLNLNGTYVVIQFKDY